MIATSPDVRLPSPRPENEAVAKALEEVAGLLEMQGANPFRVRAYREAAEAVRKVDGSVARIVQAEGPTGLMRLPRIGRSLAHSVAQFVHTGRLPLLERLRGEHSPERAFASVANIGPVLAQRIHEQLGIETLGELQQAANDGRLAQVPGIGRKRIRGVREALAGRGRWRGAAPPGAPTDVPVGELLDVDAEYRRRAQAGDLPRIAPQRFNPTRQAWLPVLHTQRGARHYTALFSNTARAHELGATSDWIVIYRDDHDDHGRWTVITSQLGRLRGRRIVRGREAECAEYYRQRDATEEATELPLWNVRAAPSARNNFTTNSRSRGSADPAQRNPARSNLGTVIPKEV